MLYIFRKTSSKISDYSIAQLLNKTAFGFGNKAEKNILMDELATRHNLNAGEFFYFIEFSNEPKLKKDSSDMHINFKNYKPSDNPFAMLKLPKNFTVQNRNLPADYLPNFSKTELQNYVGYSFDFANIFNSIDEKTVNDNFRNNKIFISQTEFSNIFEKISCILLRIYIMFV